MATTPLKSAARVLSLATIVVVSFTAWGIGTHALVVPVLSDQAPAKTNSTSVARSKPSAPPTPPNPAPNTEQRPPAKLATKPRHTTALETPHPDSESAAVPAGSVQFRPTPETEQRIVAAETHRDVATPAPPERSTIQPELGRHAFIELDPPELDHPLTTELNPRVPQPAPLRNAPRGLLQSPMTANESLLIATQLGSLQRQVELLAQAQADRKTDELKQATQLLQQLQQQKQVNQLEQQIQELLDQERNRRGNVNALADDLLAPSTEKGTGKRESDEPVSNQPPGGVEGDSLAPRKSGLLRAEPIPGQKERFSMQFQDAEISEALAMLGQLSGLNILVGRGVIGRVPAANLQDVTAEQALDAITKSLGYVYERDDHFIYVSTALDAQQRKEALRKTITKVYRPKYVSARDLMQLVTPMLSKVIGRIALNNPADTGLEMSRSKVGGDMLSQTDALVIVDFPDVIAQVDQIVAEIDVPPSQVMIEAMILSVKLDESMRMGVNFALLNSSNKHLFLSGDGSAIDAMSGATGFPGAIVPAAGQFLKTGALKYGFIQGDMTGFVEALEMLTDTSVVASPSVRVLNKQRAELIIGERIGYKTTTFNGTQSIENINFLEVGTKLVLRPFIAQDGLVRMEIHPERSDGSVNDAGLPNARTTEVTSNVMVRDGTTIVIGGLIEEQVVDSQTRVPGLGALPAVGNLFKNKTGTTNRTELIVLLTPRIIHDLDAEIEGNSVEADNERRHEEFRNRLSPINRRALAQLEYEKAARYYERCEYNKAKLHVEQSLRHNRNDTATLRLRDQIDSVQSQRSGLFRWPSQFRYKPADLYHRVPSQPSSPPDTNMILAPTIGSPEAVFDLPLPAPPAANEIPAVN